MSKLTHRYIERIINQRLMGKPIDEIARYFQVTRQGIYQIIGRFKVTQEYPALKQPGRRAQSIDLDSEKMILESYRSNNLSPIHLEKKIEETHGIHILLWYPELILHI